MEDFAKVMLCEVYENGIYARFYILLGFFVYGLKCRKFASLTFPDLFCG